jgi:hypothetical protein
MLVQTTPTTKGEKSVFREKKRANYWLEKSSITLKGKLKISIAKVRRAVHLR